MILVTSAEVLHDHVIRIGFNDGSIRDVDVGPLLTGPLYQTLRDDPELFSAVYVDPPWGGAPTWPNGADLDPYVLHGDSQPGWD